MQLLELVLENFGVYRGIHRFNLRPVVQPGHSRPIIVFTGHNGAGKSTAFMAMRLALYGPGILGDKVSQQRYEQFLQQRIHRDRPGHQSNGEDIARVELSFQYYQSGTPVEMRIVRMWKATGKSASENIALKRDNEWVDMPSSDLQYLINELVPPGLGEVCFFDAERFHALADPEQHSQVFGDAFRRLLGLNVVDRLVTDLSYYISQQGGSAHAERIRTRIKTLQTDLDLLNTQLDAAVQDLEATRADYEALHSALKEQERQLIAEGGRYAERRPMMQQRLSELQAQEQAVSEQLRELSVHLLPFALAPELCLQLTKRLSENSDADRRRAAQSLLSSAMDNLTTELNTEIWWRDISVDPAARQQIVARVSTALKQTTQELLPAEEAVIHHLAEPERQKLQTWINQALNDTCSSAETARQNLARLRVERQQLEEELRRAPEEERLAPLHAGILRLQSTLSETQQRLNARQDRDRSIRYHRDEKARELDKEDQELKRTLMNEERVKLAEQSRATLLAYSDALSQQRLKDVEAQIVTSFNRICRKDDLLRHVSISHDDYTVRLKSGGEREILLADLSAGENQLYALATLWALRTVSGRDLPLLIDTPLARLDEEHRRRFLCDYLATIGDQTILFATTEEMNSEAKDLLRPLLSRTYRLAFDAETASSRVESYDHTIPLSAR